MQIWFRKFRNAIVGVAAGVRGQNSFAVHLPVAIAVVGLAVFLRCELWQWCVLLMCISAVLSAELANSAIEYLARGLCKDHNQDVGRALDIASGAVLVVSCGAAAIGILIFANRIVVLVNMR